MKTRAQTCYSANESDPALLEAAGVAGAEEAAPVAHCGLPYLQMQPQLIGGSR